MEGMIPVLEVIGVDSIVGMVSMLEVFGVDMVSVLEVFEKEEYS